MFVRNRILLAGASVSAILSATAATAQTTPAMAAQTPAQAAGAPADEAPADQEAAQRADQADVEGVVVTGTRAPGRSRLDTLAPVDVVTARTLQQRGTTELAAALAATVPSITFPRPSTTDATDVIRPATLRGQGPDQTLVLVNGARRHVSALVNTNGSVGRGSSGADLNAIPTAAVERIEVLRDGASAQYGSDAIAGVINLRLREADHGGGVTVTLGQYFTNFEGNYGRDENIRDGRTVTVSGWQGLKLGADGFLTLSAEYRNREPTNRSDIDPRVTPPRITSRFGDPEVRDATVYANAGKPLTAEWDAYGWLGYQQREGSSAAVFRLPTDPVQNIPSVYPNGFLPLITTDTTDLSAGGGLRGTLGGFASDFNLVYGRNRIEFGVENTLNPSLGPTSPHEFYAGAVEYDQLVFGADFSREYEAGLAGPLNVAFGLEARREDYGIEQGEPGSYERGPFTQYSFPSRGFGGFTPSNALEVDRSNVGVYVDLEGEVFENFTASAAARYESYSDFGSTTTGKLSARYDFSPAFAIRGTVSNGFRAPSLQQQYYTNTAILFISGVPFETGTYPSTSAVGRALGGTALEPETSTNLSAGLVFRRGGFELTADAYRIDVEDRIILSETLTGSATAAPGTNARVIFDLLQPFGASAARFFINGVNTETEGLDVVARYRLVNELSGVFDFTTAWNVNDFRVTKTPVTQQSILPTPTSLFGRQATLRFEHGTPPWKLTLQGDWSRDAWGATFRSTYYGDVLGAGATAATDVHTGVRNLIDLEARYTLPVGLTVALGADNVFDIYPRQISRQINNTAAAPFSSFSPFGFNGRFLYGRLSYGW